MLALPTDHADTSYSRSSFRLPTVNLLARPALTFIHFRWGTLSASSAFWDSVRPEGRIHKRQCPEAAVDPCQTGAPSRILCSTVQLKRRLSAFPIPRGLTGS